MTSSTGGNQRRLHSIDVERTRRSVVYDPSRLSPANLERLVKASSRLCAEVDALTQPLPVAPDIAARILRDAMLDLRSLLAELGQIEPRADNSQ